MENLTQTYTSSKTTSMPEIPTSLASMLSVNSFQWGLRAHPRLSPSQDRTGASVELETEPFTIAMVRDAMTASRFPVYQPVN